MTPKSAPPRKAIRRISEKRLRALGGRAFSTISAPKKAVRKKPRSKSERERIYGPPGYVEWIQEQKCVGCGFSPSSCAHIKTGGMGRKADWTLTVPLCETHIDLSHGDTEAGCHGLLHHWGRETFEAIMLVDLDVEAKKTQSAWQSRISEREE